MKKNIILLAMNLLLIQEVFAINTISPKTIEGKWDCSMDYPNFETRTIDKLELFPDGRSFGLGYIFIKNEFVYETSHSGHWELIGNILLEKAKYTMTSVHPDFIMKKLKSDKNYAKEEQKITKGLKDEFAGEVPIYLEINDINKDKFEFNQIIAQERYPGTCKRSLKSPTP